MKLSHYCCSKSYYYLGAGVDVGATFVGVDTVRVDATLGVDETVLAGADLGVEETVRVGADVAGNIISNISVERVGSVS